MPKLTWDETGERLYEIGVDHGVLYVYGENGYGTGEAWNGLTEVNEAPEGAEPTDIYADNMKYLTLRSAEDFKGTINAYTFPDGWYLCDGSIMPTGTKGLVLTQQARRTFGLTYRTKIGNDTDGEDYGYKLHLIYGGTASPSSKDYQTINDSPDAMTLSWEFSTVPVNVPGHKATAHAIIDSTKADPAAMAALEAVLYGIDTTNIAAFDISKTYNVGDLVSKTETVGSAEVTKYYYCKTKISTAGAWDATKWVELDDGGPRLPLPAELITLLAIATPAA